MSLNDFLTMVVSDCVNGDEPAPPADSIIRVRECANCGEPSLGWWCSMSCRRAEDGDEREFDRDDWEGERD